MKVLWLPSGKAAVNSSLFKRLAEPRNLTVRVGLAKFVLEVEERKDLTEGTIGLPINLAEGYTIPSDIPYSCILRDGEVWIGPVIAYVDSGRFKNVKNRIFYSILPKFLDYSSVRGLIYICTADSMDFDAEIIEGYYFDPNEEDPEKVWKHGYFPLPHAVYNRSYMSPGQIALLRQKIGDTLFNSYWRNLNKWRLWAILSRDGELRKHLPYTERYSGGQQLQTLLDRYGSLYLKPYRNSRGRGIMLLTRTNTGFLVVDNTMETWEFETGQGLTRFLGQRLRNPYIVQQAVSQKFNGRKVDFRYYLQRDETKQWRGHGLRARIAPVGGIITNLRGNPDRMSGRQALAEKFNLDDSAISKVEQELTELGIRAVSKYEEMGMHLGDVAADVVIDSNLHIWLLELQLNHAIHGNTQVAAVDFFQEVLTNPFRYAKALAGFCEDPEQ